MKSFIFAWSLVFSCSASAGEAWQKALAREAEANTIFEIGSVTITFTERVLSEDDLVEKCFLRSQLVDFGHCEINSSKSVTIGSNASA